MKALSVQIFGKVQGVWFRVSTQKEADKLGLKGFVRNESDGSVYIEVEGADSKLGNFISWCRKGPQFSKVVDCKIYEISPQGFHNFAIHK
jgi:acylphosphatase